MDKTCGDCRRLLSVLLFNKNARKVDGLQNICRDCQKTRGKTYRTLNRQQLNIKSSEWKKANRPKANEYRRKAYARNPEKVKAKVSAWSSENKQSVNAKTKRWADANPAQRAARQARRVAAKLKRTPPWLTKEDFHEMAEVYRAAQKLSEETGIPFHVDHILPMQGKLVSGLHVPKNLQILQGSENCRKRNTWAPFE